MIADVANEKIGASATAEDLAMVPPDLKSRVSFVTQEALMSCVEQVRLLVCTPP